MRKSNHHLLRQALRASPEGAKVAELSESLTIGPRRVYEALKTMPDAYIDRWAPRVRGQHVAVWCVVPVPEHCPKPDRIRSHAPGVVDVSEVA